MAELDATEQEGIDLAALEISANAGDGTEQGERCVVGRAWLKQVHAELTRGRGAIAYQKAQFAMEGVCAGIERRHAERYGA